MMRMLKRLSGVLFVLGFSGVWGGWGCALPIGLIYTDVVSPRAYRSATPSEVKTSAQDEVVTGKSCAKSILGLVAWGDAGYAAAVEKAKSNLKDDRFLYDLKADSELTLVFFGAYVAACTRVTAKAGRLL